MVNPTSVTIMNYAGAWPYNLSSEGSHIFTLTPPHKHFSLPLILFSLSEPSSFTTTDSGGSVYEVMVGIKVAGIQFHFSLYCRLVIELLILPVNIPHLL